MEIDRDINIGNVGTDLLPNTVEAVFAFIPLTTFSKMILEDLQQLVESIQSGI